MELIQVGEKTYYIKNPTNIGIYKTDDHHVYLIDSGNDKDAGRKILKLISEQGWSIKGIINTHSNADHIGGNKIISDRTGCNLFAFGIEQCFVQHTLLEPSFLWGGYPFKQLKNKFLMAKDTDAKLIENTLPDGLEWVELKGHFFDMIGIKTSDNVLFLADSLFSEETIEKYHLFFIYDVSAYLDTLDMLEKTEASVFIPSHCEATENIGGLVRLNREKVNEVVEVIFNICKKPVTFEEVLRQMFEKYSLAMNANQYVLIGSTIKSYLSYLCDNGRIEFCFEDNRMLWKQVK